MGEIIDLPCDTSLAIHPDKVLEAAIGTGIEDLMLLCIDADGRFQMCLSEPDMRTALLLLELARKRIVDELETRF